MVQRRGRRGIRGAAALVALLFLLLASDAQAATIPVTTTQDELNADGDCSLREAIEAANTNAAVDSCTAGSGADIVSLAAATYALSVTGTLEDANATGDLDITSDVTISGAGSTHSVIDADGIDRVLDVRSSSSLTINRARVTDGCAAPEPTSAAGGGVRVTSGSSLAVTRAELRGNILCAGGEGGGIYVDSGASATLDKSTLAQNSAGNNGGGIAVYGSVTVTESTFSGNEAGNGGGIYNNQGTAAITNSTFSGNKANTDGGGLAVAGPSGTTTLMHVTVAGNSAHNFGLTGDGGGLRIYSGANITLNSSLIADNSVASPGQGPDCFGAVTTSNGRNLVEDTTGCTGLAGGDLTGQDPALSPLANNGGPTKTRAIAATSPAIDAAGPGCPPPATDQRGVTRAQGAACDIGAFERESAPVGTTIAVDTTQDELNGDGDCSLREAIDAANLDEQVDNCPAGDGPDTINLAATTYTLSVGGTGEDENATGDLDVDSDITFAGAGSGSTSVDANDIDRAFHVLGGNVNFSGLTIEGGGNGVCDGAGIENGSGGAVTLTSSAVSANTGGEGGGLHNGGTMTLTNTTVSGNTAVKRGAGIANSGTMTLDHSTVSGNTNTGGATGDPPCPGLATFGAGGIFNSDGGASTVTESTVSGNSGALNGGGLYNFGPTAASTLTVSRSTVSGNTAGNLGGGIANAGGATATITNSTISGNSATSSPGDVGGGGVWNGSGTTTLTSGTVSGNTSSFGAGGLARSSGALNVGNTIVTDGCTGTLTSNDHNIDSGTSCGFGGPNDQQSTDPLLGALASNGGPTQTRKLGAGSPAIDSGACFSLSSDQRGVARPQGAACDIGAFETTPPSTSITFPANSQLYNASSYGAGCGGGTPDACGAAVKNPDGANLNQVEVRIRRASDGRYWNGASWQDGETWNMASGTGSWDYGFVPADDTYTLSSRATDNDGYVESTATVTFTVDTTPPDAPTLTSTSPASPANDNSPKLSGAAEPGSTVRLYADGSCSSLAATADASTFASPGIGVTVPDNSTTSFHATATDPAGNTSPCSSDSATYVEDSDAPEATIDSARIKQSKHKAKFKFSSSEPGATFLCKLDKQDFAPCGSPEVYKHLKERKHKFYVEARDAAGNVGPPELDKFRIRG